MIIYRLPRYGMKQSSEEARNLADDISIYVQERGGEFAIHRHCIDFYVPKKYDTFVRIMYPFLERVVEQQQSGASK